MPARPYQTADWTSLPQDVLLLILKLSFSLATRGCAAAPARSSIVCKAWSSAVTQRGGAPPRDLGPRPVVSWARV
jgi:hypothetical protein